MLVLKGEQIRLLFFLLAGLVFMLQKFSMTSCQIEPKKNISCKLTTSEINLGKLSLRDINFERKTKEIIHTKRQARVHEL